ncbi:hypothetical protein ACNKHN_21910 [Shigella flexneri]
MFIDGMEEGMFRARCRWMKAGIWKKNTVWPTWRNPRDAETDADLHGKRSVYGEEVSSPSRFMGELPEECVEGVRLPPAIRFTVSRRAWLRRWSRTTAAISYGQRVRHAKFGEGASRCSGRQRRA